MKKYYFVFATRFNVYATLFQKGLQKKVNKYLHLTLMKKLEYIELNNAALSGNISCLKYAFCVVKATDNNLTLSYAAKSGNISCLKYVHEVIKATDVHKYTLYDAAASGSFACLKYAFCIIKAKDVHKCALCYAEKSKNLDCIEYCKKYIK